MKKTIALLSAILMLSSFGISLANAQSEVKIIDISQTVIMMEVKKGLKIADAVDAMISKASEINLKMVGRQKIHEEMRSRGKKVPHLEILQFCDPEDAVQLVQKDPLYSVYMPCRISVVEDAKGKVWMFMLNLDMLINSNSLGPKLQEIAIRVNQSMLAVITAGVTGEF